MPIEWKELFTYDNLVHAVSGSVGSIVGMAVFYPLDTVRCRLQLEEKKKSNGTISVLIQLVREEGMSTLYRGILPVLQSICVSNFVYFYTYNGLKATFKAEGNDLQLASLAGIINVLVTTPLWMVNTRMKMSGVTSHLQYKGLFDGLVQVWQTEGPKRLWSGTAPSLILVANPAIHMAIYQAVKRRFGGGQELTATAYFFMSAFAKTIATVLTYPLQLIQTKLRHGHGHSDLTPDAGSVQLLLYLLRRNGLEGVYKGMEAKILQTVLTTALMFTTYEKIAAFVLKIMRGKMRKHL